MVAIAIAGFFINYISTYKHMFMWGGPIVITTYNTSTYVKYLNRIYRSKYPIRRGFSNYLQDKYLRQSLPKIGYIYPNILFVTPCCVSTYNDPSPPTPHRKPLWRKDLYQLHLVINPYCTSTYIKCNRMNNSRKCNCNIMQLIIYLN